MPPAARVTDMHACPMVTSHVAHLGGPVLPSGCPSVLIGGLPAAQVGDALCCTGPPDNITQGSASVLIGNRPAARVGDKTAHGGIIVSGHPATLIGEAGSGGTGSAGGGRLVGTVGAAAAQGEALVAAKESAAAFTEVAEGLPPRVLGELRPRPERHQQTACRICHLEELVVKCGHTQRSCEFRVGKIDEFGRRQDTLEVVCGPEGDEIEVSVRMSKPFCGNHRERPLRVVGADTREQGSPTSASARFEASSTLGLEVPDRNRLLSCIWPRGLAPRKYPICVGSCKGACAASVHAYPDLRWEIGLDIDLGPGHQGRNEAAKGAEASAPSLICRVSSGRQTIDLGKELDTYVKTGLSVGRLAMNVVRETSELLRKWADVHLEIKPPRLSISGEWGWKELAGSSLAGYEVQAGGALEPLIGADVQVDIIGVLLSATGSPALNRLRKLASSVEVGVLFGVAGEISGKFTVTKELRQSKWGGSGRLEGTVVASLEGRIKLEKRIFCFSVSGTGRAGGKSTLNVTASETFQDRHGFGMVLGKASWDPLELYVECVLRAGYEVASHEEPDAGADGPPAESEGGYKYRLSHKMWDEIQLYDGKKCYFIRNAD